MISAAERYCSNRVLMLTRVKGCCHYLGAEGAVTVKCTFPGLWWLLHSLTSLQASDIQIITSLWLFMGKWINGTSQKSHWSGPVKQWSHRLWSECAEFILAWIIKNFHQIINLTVKLSSAYRLWLHFCEHELQPLLHTHEFQQLPHRGNLFTMNHCDILLTCLCWVFHCITNVF